MADAVAERLVDRAWWNADWISQAIAVPDLSREGTFPGLELGGTRWAEVARTGCFGHSRAWEK